MSNAVKYYSEKNRADYAPPMLGNGEIALQLDFMGQMAYEVTEADAPLPEAERPSRSHATNNIWWAGRRYIYDFMRFLIPFGQLLTRVEGQPDRPRAWSQSLDPEEAKMEAACIYENGDELETEAFVHHDMNLVAIRRRFMRETGGPIHYDYILRDNKGRAPEGSLPPYMEASATRDRVTGGLRIRYKVTGQWDYEGVILFFGDHPLAADWKDNRFTLTDCTGEGGELYLILRDNIDEAEYEEVAENQAKHVLAAGFDALFGEHRKAWAQFLAEGEVNLPDERLMRVYRAARYDSGAYTTRWSIPVGLSDCCWEGKFFAYDEYFTYIGLLTGGHRQLAERVPRFRREGLPQAIQRMSSGGLKVKEARYVWETAETGEEAARPGFWYEHIFHMANISVGAWEYFAYTNDLDYLRGSAYPVMRACAEFYLRHMVYRVEGGKTIIGKCTDWERLGSSVENAYMTTCSVIRTLRLTAQAAQILGVEPEFVKEARATADALWKDLPNDGEKYIPHPGCGQKSIGVFGGMFPYRVNEEDNPLQRAAIEDYKLYEGTYGNMYAVGGGVSSWFAAWKSIAYARMHEPEAAMACLRQSADSEGCFGELFEINEKKCIYRPWFTTSNGLYQAAVHSLLLQSGEGFVDLLPGWPRGEGDVSFTLPAEGDLTVSVRVREGRLEELILAPGERCALKEVSVRLPDWLRLEDAKVDAGGLTLRAE